MIRITILVGKHGSQHYKAGIDGKRGFVTGQNIYEAIGDLIVHSPEDFEEGGIRVAHDESSYANGVCGVEGMTISASQLQKDDEILYEGEYVRVAHVARLSNLDLMTVYYEGMDKHFNIEKYQQRRVAILKSGMKAAKVGA